MSVRTLEPVSWIRLIFCALDGSPAGWDTFEAWTRLARGEVWPRRRCTKESNGQLLQRMFDRDQLHWLGSLFNSSPPYPVWHAAVSAFCRTRLPDFIWDRHRLFSASTCSRGFLTIMRYAFALDTGNFVRDTASPSLSMTKLFLKEASCGTLWFLRSLRECHLCRVAGNTVWSHVACEFP